MRQRGLCSALALPILIVVAACGNITFQNDNGQEAGFDISFPHGGAFPHVSSADNVLLLAVSDTDTGDPVTVRIYIDDVEVRTLTNPGLHSELPFPPAAWSPSVGTHTVSVESGGDKRELAFTWQ